MVPNIFHFIFGLAPDFGGKPFSLMNYLAIKSAYEINKPDRIFFYYKHLPEGVWWEEAKSYLTLEEINPPVTIYNNKLYHFAHVSDILRLQILIERGGIYLDIDTICVKPFQPLLNHEFVIGEQVVNDKLIGLCNAVMLSSKDSLFCNCWLEQYQYFRSKGKDIYWDEHSVFIPYLISQVPEIKGSFFIANFKSFHYPSFTENDTKLMFEENHEFGEAFCHHLWETFTYEKYLKTLTTASIKVQDTTYNLIARRFID